MGRSPLKRARPTPTTPHADISKANELLGYEPSTDSREGVRQCSDWDRANQEWDELFVRES